jgi:hypothetical protein
LKSERTPTKTWFQKNMVSKSKREKKEKEKRKKKKAKKNVPCISNKIQKTENKNTNKKKRELKNEMSKKE